VLAVDPSSTRTGGSILGDKTRMEELTRRDAAFIRPSPSGGSLGGVARRTREAMLLCEAAGFDVVLVETVGVGQSEVTVAGMVDLFLLLVAPGGGDELQGIKRGIVELADLVIVNKADGDLMGPSRIAAAEYANALHLLRRRTPEWEPRVLSVSSIERTGIDEFWATVEEFRATLTAAGALKTRRAEQAGDWMWTELLDGLTEALRHDATTMELVAGLEADVRAGRVAPPIAARRLLDGFLHRP
jgi:LAO/AO transport system kinase